MAQKSTSLYSSTMPSSNTQRPQKPAAVEFKQLSSNSKLSKMREIMGHDDRRDFDLSKEQLVTMFAKEEAYHIPLVPCKISDGNHWIGEEWRRKIADWSFRVVDSFALDRSISSLSLHLLDLFVAKYNFPVMDERPCSCLQCKRSFDSQTFQLASMACLFLAIKVSPECESDSEVCRRQTIRIRRFVDFSRGMFSQEDILRMEAKVLRVLEWKVNPPTATSFLPYLLDLLPPTEFLHPQSQAYYPLVKLVLREVSRYLCELSVSRGREVGDAYTSEVAYASILVAMKILTLEALPHSSREYFSNAFFQMSHCRLVMIEALKTMFMSMLWPEMLLQDGNAPMHETAHPISLAQYYGLLDFTSFQKTCNSWDYTPPGSPIHSPKSSSSSSPRSVSSLG